MADTKNSLPEGTDTVIEGGGTGGGGGPASRSGTALGGGSPSTGGNSTGARTSTTSSADPTNALITADGGSSGAANEGSTSKPGVKGMISSASTKAKDEAATRARGFVGDGLKSGSATLGNIANIIEDTVEQIGERLGPQYADYARTASETINRYATTLENKDPDELVDDARDLIRKSPAVALTAAAVVGFGIARLFKAGMPEDSGSGSGSGSGSATDSSSGTRANRRSTGV